MLQKIKLFPYQRYLNELRDVRVLGLVVFGIITLMVTYMGLGVIQDNYDLQKQQSRIEQTNEVLELGNNNQKLRNQYYNTDTYLELSARKQFGIAAPGETLVLIPKSVALAHTTEIAAPKAAKAVAKPQKPLYQKNFEAWMAFFLHRQPPDDAS